MKKAILQLLMVFIIAGSLTACGTNKSNQEDGSAKTVQEQMQEYHIKYVGDSSGVSKLLSFLPQFDKNYIQKMFSLQSSTKPYGITIYYEPAKKTKVPSMKKTKEMTTYANYLFETIDNLGYIEYAYRTTPSNNKLEQSEYKILLKVERPQ